MTSNQRIAFYLGAVAIIVVSVMIVLSGSSTTTDPNAGVSLTENITEDDWTLGNPDAKIQIVEYSDFQCPACQFYFPTIKSVVNEFSNHVYFAYRHYPIRSAHPLADLAARASEAAGQQGDFWGMHDLLFQTQTQWSQLSEPQARQAFIDYAESLELDTEKFADYMDSSAAQSRVDEDFKTGIASKVPGTPSLFLNGIKFNGNPTLEDFRALIRSELERIEAEESAAAESTPITQ